MLYAVRANYTKHTIVVYQAYNDAIADAALAAQKLVDPFSYHRMTWIKPSFLWLMHRSQWAQKSGQTRILGIHIQRTAFDHALESGVLTHPEPSIHGTYERWQTLFDNAKVHVQWDTERTLDGKPLNYYSIQVGISRHLIEAFATEWITRIDDMTPLVRKIQKQRHHKNKKHRKINLPPERPYPLSTAHQHLILNA